MDSFTASEYRAVQRPPRARAWAVAGLFALAAGAVFAAAPLVGSPASAHNYLVSSNPTAGSTVTEQPGTFVVTTNDALLDLGGDTASNQIQVMGPGAEKSYYGTGCTTVNGPALTLPAELGQPGEYTVIWQVVSTDGHPISNEFTFTWAPDAEQALAAGSPTPPVCGETGAPGASDGSSDAASSAPEDDAGASAAPESPRSSPEMTTQGESGESSAAAGDILWIGGAVLVILVAGLVVVFVLRRRSPHDADSDVSPSDGPSLDEK